MSTNELHGNTLPERTVGSSGLLLSFGLAEECSCSVQVDRHYGPLLARLTLCVPVACGMAPSKTIIVYLYLFIYFYLVLGMSSFGNVCSAIDSFE